MENAKVIYPSSKESNENLIFEKGKERYILKKGGKILWVYEFSKNEMNYSIFPTNKNKIGMLIEIGSFSNNFDFQEKYRKASLKHAIRHSKSTNRTLIDVLDVLE